MYMVSDYVLDDETGYMIQNASIYEKRLLASALTSKNGYFQLQLKSEAKTAALGLYKVMAFNDLKPHYCTTAG